MSSTPRQLAEKIGLEYHWAHIRADMGRRYSVGGFNECTHEICEDSRELIRTCEVMETALTKITTPEGVYRRDKAEYRANVIEWCKETAQEALKELKEPTNVN